MRAIFRIVWFIVLYYAAYTGAASIAGQLASREYSGGMAQVVAKRASHRFLVDYHAYIMAGTGVLTIVASGAGLLPGTRRAS